METNELVKQLISQRDKLNTAIQALMTDDDTVQPETVKRGPGRPKMVQLEAPVTQEEQVQPITPPNGVRHGGMSTAARAAISAAQKKRWKVYRANIAKLATTGK